MGRIIRVGSGPPIPAGNTNMSFRMNKLTKPWERAEDCPACPECEISVDGLYWQDMSESFDVIIQYKGPFDITSDITEYVEDSGGGTLRPVGFWMHAAKLVGELCGNEVTWNFVWPPLCSAPRAWIDGPYCVLIPGLYDDSRNYAIASPGTLSVTATVAGVTYGPLHLIIEEDVY